MQYKVVYRAYNLSLLMEKSKDEKTGLYVFRDMEDLTKDINEYANFGWIVKETGTIKSGKNIIFWALMEREKWQ